MELFIENARTNAQVKAIRDIETEVFGNEKAVSLPPLSAQPGGLLFRLLASDELTGVPMATLSVAVGEAHPRFLDRYDSLIRSGATAARFTRLAVRREFRGRGIHLRMLLEAQQRFIAPRGIRYTWFLCDAARETPSLMEKMLCFQRHPGVVESEYGPCCLLSRDEFSLAAWNGNRNTWACIASLGDAPAD